MRKGLFFISLLSLVIGVLESLGFAAQPEESVAVQIIVFQKSHHELDLNKVNASLKKFRDALKLGEAKLLAKDLLPVSSKAKKYLGYSFSKSKNHLVISNNSQPMFEDPEPWASQTSDPRIKKVLLEHKAHLTFSWDGAIRESEFSKIYSSLGYFAAEAIDQNTLGIYLAPIGRIYPNSDSSKLKANLLSKDPFESLQADLDPPIVDVPEDHPELIAAKKAAKESLSEFIQAFHEESSKSENNFSVKVPLSEGEKKEWLWISVHQISGQFLEGTVGNDPIHLKKVKLGSKIRIELKDIEDWLIVGNDSMRGGFTVKVLQKYLNAQ